MSITRKGRPLDLAGVEIGASLRITGAGATFGLRADTEQWTRVETQREPDAKGVKSLRFNPFCSSDGFVLI